MKVAEVLRLLFRTMVGFLRVPGEATAEQAEAEIREAIEFHLGGMREDGLPIPEPSSKVEYVDVSA